MGGNIADPINIYRYVVSLIVGPRCLGVPDLLSVVLLSHISEKCVMCCFKGMSIGLERIIILVK